MVSLRIFALLFLSAVTLRAEEGLVAMARDVELNCDAFFLALRGEERPMDAIRDAQQRTLLHLAAAAHNQQNTFILLQRGANPNARDATGATPLHYAVATTGDDSQWVWQMLCLRGADLSALDQRGVSPLAVAVQNKNRRAVEFLTWLGAEIMPQGVAHANQPLTLARELGDRDILRTLEMSLAPDAIFRRATPRQVPEFVKAQFITAAQQGEYLVLEQLLASGVPIDTQDERGRTALFRATESNQDSAVTFLLFLGANPNVATPDGRTPLAPITNYFGFSYDFMSSMLVLAGADVLKPAEDGRSVLSKWAEHGNAWALRWALWSGIDPGAVTQQGTLMHLASKNSRQPLMELLQKYGVTEPPFVGHTPGWKFFDAVKRDDVAGVERELDAGMDVDAADGSGSSALMLAILANQWDSANAFLARGANVNFVNEKTGWSPLLAASLWNSPQATRLRAKLLAAGADAKVRATNGLTPLTRIIFPVGGNEGIAQLVRAGADIHAADGKGRTPLAIAREFKNKEAERILLGLGAEY
jgi:ankyrin repeat protein